jgi:hypothetical protein
MSTGLRSIKDLWPGDRFYLANGCPCIYERYVDVNYDKHRAIYENGGKDLELNGTTDVMLALRWGDILQRLIDGKCYRRRAWVEGVYISFDCMSKFVTLHGRTAPARWSPYQDDFSEDDWEEVIL